MSKLIATLVLIVSPVLASAQVELQLLPDTVSEGADVNGIVRGDARFSPRVLRISGVDDRVKQGVQSLHVARRDHDVTIGVHLDPGCRQVLLDNKRTQLGTIEGTSAAPPERLEAVSTRSQKKPFASLAEPVRSSTLRPRRSRAWQLNFQAGG